jgi:hypothetical protein
MNLPILTIYRGYHGKSAQLELIEVEGSADSFILRPFVSFIYRGVTVPIGGAGSLLAFQLMISCKYDDTAKGTCLSSD